MKLDNRAFKKRAHLHGVYEDPDRFDAVDPGSNESGQGFLSTSPVNEASVNQVTTTDKDLVPRKATIPAMKP